MAADPGIQKPGTKYGPCAEPCKHRDCAQARDIAASACWICKKAIGYKTRFYRNEADSASGWVHADCFEDAIDRELAQRATA